MLSEKYNIDRILEDLSSLFPYPSGIYYSILQKAIKNQSVNLSMFLIMIAYNDLHDSAGISSSIDINSEYSENTFDSYNKIMDEISNLIGNKKYTEIKKIIKENDFDNIKFSIKHAKCIINDCNNNLTDKNFFEFLISKKLFSTAKFFFSEIDTDITEEKSKTILKYYKYDATETEPTTDILDKLESENILYDTDMELYYKHKLK